MASWWNNLRRQGAIARVAMVVAATVVVLALVSPVAGYLRGATSVAAASVAAVLCLLGAIGAMLAGELLRQPDRMLAAVGLGMALRMAVPLGLGLTIHLHGGPLAKAGLLYYLLIFYPVTLAVETWLTLPRIEPGAKAASACGAKI